MSSMPVFSYDDNKPPQRVGWFDPTEATVYRGKPSVEHRGHDGIVEWALPQTLYRTSADEWVRVVEVDSLHSRVEYFSDQEASMWLAEHGFDSQDGDSSAAARGPGRPEVGGLVQVRLGELLKSVDEFAHERDLSRSAAIRHLLRVGLTANE